MDPQNTARVDGSERVTDKEFNKQKARTAKIFKHWCWMLGLNTWVKVTLEYWREPLTPRPSEEPYHPLATPEADCLAKWEYKTAHMRICLADAADMDDDALERTIVHELCHCLVNEMRCYPEGINHEEHVVTSLAQAFHWVQKITADETKKALKRG